MPYLSKRFALKRFLGLSEEEMAQNQKMWSEEKGESKEDGVQGADLRNVGVTGGGIASDLDAQTGETEPDAPIEAGEEGEGVGGDEGDEEV